MRKTYNSINKIKSDTQQFTIGIHIVKVEVFMTNCKK